MYFETPLLENLCSFIRFHQYSNNRQHSNVLSVANQITFNKSSHFNRAIANKSNNHIPFNVRAGVTTKRDRDRSQNLIDATLNPISAYDISTQNMSPVEDLSPRIRPSGNLKLTTQMKVGSIINATKASSKRRITDWIFIANNNIGTTHKYNDSSTDLVLLNCPGRKSDKTSRKSKK